VSSVVIMELNDAPQNLKIIIDPSATVDELLHEITTVFQLINPSVRANGKSLYMRKPEQLEQATRVNLPLPVAAFLEDGDYIYVSYESGSCEGGFYTSVPMVVNFRVASLKFKCLRLLARSIQQTYQGNNTGNNNKTCYDIERLFEVLPYEVLELLEQQII